MTDLTDSHAHVWDRSCTYVSGARYHPGYEATIDDYLQLLDSHEIQRAILVQPSFLGSDNTYLLEALRRHPDRLRGVVVLDPAVSDAALDDMAALGVIGHRYNLLSLPFEELWAPAYRDLTNRLTTRNWWTQIQAPGLVWADVVPLMRQAGAKLIVDHFGLPSGSGCPGIAALRSIDPEHVVLKLSAPYRQTTAHFTVAVRQGMKTRQSIGLLWGSDWPWTQHEGQHCYQASIDWLEDWTTPAEQKAREAAQNMLWRLPNRA